MGAPGCSCSPPCYVLWHRLRCLRRRSQRHKLTRRKMMRIAQRWLPSPKLRHPYPDWRFDVMTRVGVRCVSSPRRDLRGGWRAIAVPTATSYISRLINTLLFVDIAWRILVPLRRSPPAPTRGRSAACKAVFDPDLEPGSNANVVVRREPATGEVTRRWSSKTLADA